MSNILLDSFVFKHVVITGSKAFSYHQVERYNIPPNTIWVTTRWRGGDDNYNKSDDDHDNQDDDLIMKVVADDDDHDVGDY